MPEHYPASFKKEVIDWLSENQITLIQGMGNNEVPMSVGIKSATPTKTALPQISPLLTSPTKP
jgi:hypothetical protein